MRTTTRTLGLVLGGCLLAGSARADNAPPSDGDRIAVDVEIEIDSLADAGLLMLSPIACQGGKDPDYVIVTRDTGVIERRVGDDEDEECESQTLYALPDERFPVVDGKMPAFDALTADEREAVLAGPDVSRYYLDEPWWWAPALVFVRDIRADYRFQRVDESRHELELVRYEVAYEAGQTVSLCPGDLYPLRFDGQGEPTVERPDDPPAPERSVCPPCAVCPAAAPAPAPAPLPPPVAADPPAPAPVETAASGRAIDPNLERALLGGACLLVGGLAGFGLRRKR